MFYTYRMGDNRICLYPMGGALPQGAEPCGEAFCPLVIPVLRDPFTSRGIFCVHSPEEVTEAEGPCVLTEIPGEGNSRGDAVADLIRANGAMVVNTAFAHCWEQAARTLFPKRDGLRLDLVGLGDVGGTLLTALKLLGGDRISEIGIYDFNEAQCARYEMELSQVLEHPAPRIVARRFEDLFEGDALLFTASRGVPPVGAEGDMRMLQFEKNREMLKSYTALARGKHYQGLFLQIADPVDLLSRTIFLNTNRAEDGSFDFAGLMPEQVMGFGLGVMAARAGYMAARRGVGTDTIAAFGPHGNGLVVANDPSPDGYDEALSLALTEDTVKANMEVRALGFKPYIAPALSSACISILNLFAGRPFYGTAPLDGVYFGSRLTMTSLGLRRLRQPLAEGLVKRMEATVSGLKAMEDACRS